MEGIWWHLVYRVSSEIWPNRSGLISVRKREIWMWEAFFGGKVKEKEEMKGARVQAYTVSSNTLTILEYLKGSEKERIRQKREKNQKRKYYYYGSFECKNVFVFAKKNFAHS